MILIRLLVSGILNNYYGFTLSNLFFSKKKPLCETYQIQQKHKEIGTRNPESTVEQ
jgi:hypothetical protein